MASKNNDYSTATLIPFDEPLNREFLMKKAEAELNETEENREKGLKELRALINEHNVHCVTTDDFLLRFLRARKFQVQRSFEALQNYCKERVYFHHMFMNLPPEILESCLRNMVFGILPYRDYEGRQIFYVKEGKWKESICSEDEAMTAIIVAFSYALEDESAQINGLHLLLEESSFSLGNVLIGIKHLYARKDFIFKYAPVRYPRIDIMNEPLLFNVALAIAKPFLPEKIQNRIFLHGKSKDELAQLIPQSLLQTGSESSVDNPFANHNLIGILKDYFQKFKEEQMHFVSEQSEQ